MISGYGGGIFDEELGIKYPFEQCMLGTPDGCDGSGALYTGGCNDFRDVYTRYAENT